MIKSKFLFILIGDDKTGKTTLQKMILKKLCKQNKDERLQCNLQFDVLHEEIKRKYQNASFANRSFQERIDTYVSVDNYFNEHFQPADICFISSHVVPGDISQMIQNGNSRFYNVYGVFFSNSISLNRSLNSQIAGLDWHEKLVIANDYVNSEEEVVAQLDKIAESIIDFIINRTSIS